MLLLVGTRVRFLERCRPQQVPRGTIGAILDVEERPTPNSGADYRIQACFGDFIMPWIEAWQLERVS
jgi:hypothetical protein